MEAGLIEVVDPDDDYLGIEIRARTEGSPVLRSSTRVSTS
jgi:hypothetical protein